MRPIWSFNFIGLKECDEVTDVLAFPYHEIKPNEHISHLNLKDEERMLGDIVLALPYIKAESQKHKEDFDCVLLTMIAHGLCHLIGFDHETKEQWEEMYKKELEILNKFNNTAGYKCSPLLSVGH
ncbi:ribonuclease [Biomphalaria pfeifferi]|uniref:Ribonuclease n=1 Tax=Biomphalaria pfeifferi TaxID=112525 RepID=A0AAD8F3M5_BIOPF|nr:ribonuclease [Biomphalaria pfeifferi]